MSKRATGSRPAPKPAGPYKSAVSGLFVSKHYATTHPKTTYKLGKGK